MRKNNFDKRYNWRQTLFIIIFSLAPVVLGVIGYLIGVRWGHLNSISKLIICVLGIAYYYFVQRIINKF